MKNFIIPEDPLIWPRENEGGNVEYKSYLSSEHDNVRKIERLSTQMKWRLYEGEQLYNKSRAIYILGVMDDGTIFGMDKKARNDSIDIVEKVATVCKATIYKIIILKTIKGEIVVLYIQGCNDCKKNVRGFLL